ncbi:MAG: hypothetical protein AAF170_00490 [Bacteroidota bacterium]
MLRLLPVAALVLFAFPALGQGTGAAPTLPDVSLQVDEALVGTWELAEVEDGGLMAELGAQIDALVLRIEADGDALVGLEVTQDLETMTREDTFNCVTVDGEIRPDDRAAISYEVLGEDELRLVDPEGVIVRMKRAEPEVVSEPGLTQ